MKLPSYHIHVTENETILYFCEDKIIGVPLSFSSLKVEMYNGLAYIGDLEKGGVWCTEWRYGLHLGKLCVVCQVETEIDFLKAALSAKELIG